MSGKLQFIYGSAFGLLWVAGCADVAWDAAKLLGQLARPSIGPFAGPLVLLGGAALASAFAIAPFWLLKRRVCLYFLVGSPYLFLSVWDVFELAFYPNWTRVVPLSALAAFAAWAVAWCSSILGLSLRIGVEGAWHRGPGRCRGGHVCVAANGLGSAQRRRSLYDGGGGAGDRRTAIEGLPAKTSARSHGKACGPEGVTFGSHST